MPTEKTVLGHNTTYTLDTYNRVTQQTNPEGDYIQYSYDSRGNFDQATHVSKDGTQSITYRATFPQSCANVKTCNKPTATFDANNNETDYVYDDNSGEVKTLIKPADANGLRAQIQYTYTPLYAQVMTSAGTLTSQSTPIYLLTEVTQCGTTASCTNTADEHVTDYTYDNNLFPTSMKQRAGDNSLSVTTTTTYDMIGNPVVVDGPRTDVDDRSYRTYDAMRRVIFEIGVDPDGSGPLPRAIVHHIYDDAGFEIQTEAGTGNATDGSDFVRASYVTTAYNSAGLKSTVATYIAGNSTPQTVTQYSYDPSGRMICSTVRMNPSVFSTIGNTDACTLGTASAYGPDRITLSSYDTGDEVLETDQACGVTTANGFPQTLQRAYARYTYNPNGTKATEMDADGNMTAYVYDGFDRLSQIQYPSPAVGSGTANTADYEQFGYDANGNRTSWRRRNGYTIGYSYDALNRQILEDVPVSPGNANGSDMDLSTAYDLQGHVQYRYLGNGQETYYNYNALGELTSSSDPSGRVNWYQYNQAGARTYLVMPDGHWVNYTLDNTNRVTQISHDVDGVLATLTYDNLGRRASLYRGGGGVAGQTVYSYDNLGRLTALTNDFATSAYDITWSFTGYNPANQIVSQGSSSSAYDYVETTNSTVNQTYDGLNRDASVAAISGGYDADGNLANDGTRVMTYDAFNRLLSVANASSPSSPYLTITYDPEGRISTYTAYGTGTTFGYDGTELIGEYSGSTIVRQYVSLGADEPLVWFEGPAYSNRSYFFQDYHGSVVALSDASGNLDALYKYGPYGEPKDVFNNPSWSGSRFRYTGQLMMFEAQLYYYKARVYDPIFGRFLQTDPIGSKDDLDLYAYTADDPIDHTDPTGDQSVGVGAYVGPSGCDAACQNGFSDFVSKGADALSGLADGLASCGCAASMASPELRIVSSETQAVADDLQASRIATNAADGARREATGLSKLATDNPEANVQPQAYLRNSSGNIVKDPVTGQSRRVDAAVIQNGKASTVEITSPTANKTAQAAKEQRIIDNGGTYVRNGNGKKAPVVPVDGPSKRINIP